MAGSVPVSGSQLLLGCELLALQERVVARLAARQPVWDLIAAQAQRRATEAALWTLDRGWPVGRLREAWVVWRYGSQCAGELGSAPAGQVQCDDLERLRRALGRYERHRAARPSAFPAGGVAVLAVIAAIAGQHNARPQTLHYAIRVLDQLSRRMRAADTCDDSERRDRAAARAQRRRFAGQPAGVPGFSWRTSSSPWPHWVALDKTGYPLLQDDELVIVDPPGLAQAPDRGEECYRQTLRDAQLLARRRARPGPYGPPPGRHAHTDVGDVRLAQRADMPLQAVMRLSSSTRDKLLEHHSATLAARRQHERDALWARLSAAQTQGAPWSQTTASDPGEGRV
jgi:hypothetical protein